MKVGLFIGLLLAAISVFTIKELASDQFTDFQAWKTQFNIKFPSQSEQFYRRALYYSNIEKIGRHNSDPTQTYKQGINQFSIYTEEEFIERFLSGKYVKLQNTNQKQQNNLQAVLIDWTLKGAVAPTKNQGMCGGGALFSTLGGVSSLSKVATGTLQIFSDQQLIDCVFGCSGSLANNGYKYYQSHSVCTPSEYPYTGKQGNCQNVACKFKISGFKTVATCDDLSRAIMSQPISVAVDAGKWSPYASGVFSNCGTSINHQVLLVGMADEYWKCQNSWGTAWGEQGFIRLARGNTCGICSYASFPTF